MYDPIRWLLGYRLADLPLLVFPLTAALVIAIFLEIRRRKWTVKDVSIIAAMTAACLASNYALIAIPNVKLMDLIVFATGLQFGAVVGGSVGVFVWMIYGSINPYGFEPLTWVVTMSAEAIYGIVGGVAGAAFRRNHFVPTNRVKLTLMGIGSTLGYDLLTNLIPALALSYLFLGGLNWPYLGIYMANGAVFSGIHIVTNGLLFFFALVPLTRALLNVRGSMTA